MIGVILAPIVYLACAQSLAEWLEPIELPILEVQERCASDRDWLPGQIGILACSSLVEGLVVMVEGMPEDMRHAVLVHEAAHFCGWPNDHPGEWTIKKFDYDFH